MSRFWQIIKQHWQAIFLIAALIAVIASVSLYRLGSLVPALSSTEMRNASQPAGWHGIYLDPFYLPLVVVRSAIFRFSTSHNALMSRLPSTIFGGLTVISLGVVVNIWHGRRTAFLAVLLFACGSWALHSSRYVSNDVLYLWAAPTLVLANALIHRSSKTKKKATLYLSVAIFGVLLYVPGLIWLIVASILLLRRELLICWHSINRLWQRLVLVLCFIVWLPLLIIDFVRSPPATLTWLGLPTHYAHPLQLLKNFVEVFIHLFIRGPKSPTVWLGHLPILDIFTLGMCLYGIYFYAKHYHAARSRTLTTMFIISTILIALHGPVTLSLVVPILYLFAASGIAFLLQTWLQKFPFNPLARTLGIGFVVIAVAVSCMFNLRSYFIAWPHDPTTAADFRVEQ